MSYALGIDLGTSFTAAAVWRLGRTDIIDLGRQRPQIPTVVHLSADGELLVGEAAERRAVSDPEGVVRDFKRRLGDQVGTVVRGQLWSAESLMAAVLGHVLALASTREGGPPDAVALAHPASWGPYKLDLLREVGRLAGLRNVTLVAEPVAAAWHAATTGRIEAGQPVVVYDLGGGTFDVSVVRAAENSSCGGVVIGAPDGLERLGGIDFDEALRQLVEHLIGLPLASLATDDPAVLRGVAQLRADLVAAKEALSTETSVEVPLFLPGLPPVVRVTRAELEAAIEPRIRDTMLVTERVIEEAGLQDVERGRMAVLLVGGSSRIPLVGGLVAEQLRLPTAVDEHPKYPVALGAALGGAAHISEPAPAPQQTPEPAESAGATPTATAEEPSEPAGTTATAEVGGLGEGSAPAPSDMGTVAAMAARQRWRRMLPVAGVAVAAVVTAGALVARTGDDPANPLDPKRIEQAATGSITASSAASSTSAAPPTTVPAGAASVLPTASSGAGSIAPAPVLAEQAATAAPTIVVVAGGNGSSNGISGRTDNGTTVDDGRGSVAPTVAPTTAPTPAPSASTAPPPVPTVARDPNALTAGAYQEGAATYSTGWATCTASLGQSGGCDMWTSAPGRSYTISFHGTGIVVYGAKAFNGGMMDFTIDGTHSVRADSYFDGNSNRRLDTQEYYRVTDLPLGDHTLRATMAADRNPANGESTVYVTLDRFDVMG